jgi:ribosome-binding factor A
MNPKRKSRLEHDIKRYLSQIVHKSIKDPRVNEHLTVTEVRITEDMKYAKVFISSIGEEKERKESVDILNKAKGYIRKELSSNLNTRFTPEIIFYLDESIENSIKINTLLKSLNEEIKD